MINPLDSYIISNSTALTNDYEELSALELIGKTATKTNELVAAVNDEVTDREAAVTGEAAARTAAITAALAGITTDRKLSATGDFTGTLNGVPITNADQNKSPKTDYFLTDFGAVASNTDITSVLQTALGTLNTVGGRLFIPKGNYTISDTIAVNRGVSIVATGLVKLAYAITDTSKPMFKLCATSDIDSDNAVLDGVWLDGGQAGMLLTNTGSVATAIQIGTESDTAYDNRVQTIRNVGIKGFNIGVRFTKYDNYIMKLMDCVMQWCNYGVLFGIEGTIESVSNAGENIVFINCVFGSIYKSAFRWNCTGFDVNCFGCSFDFCEAVFSVLDGTAGGKVINVYGGHIEGVNNYTGDNASSDPYGIYCGTTSTSNLGYEFRNQLNLDGTAIMLTNKKTVFRGNGEVNLTNVKIKLTGTVMNTKLASLLSLRDTTACKVNFKGISFPNARYGMKMPSLQQNLIPFSEFEDLSVQTGLSTTSQINKAYKINFKRNTDDAVNVIDGGPFGGKYIEVEFHDYGVTNTYLTFNIDTNRSLPVHAGKELILFPVFMFTTLPSVYHLSATYNFYSGTDLISSQSSVYFRYGTSIPGSAWTIGVDSNDVNQWLVPFNQIDKVIVPQGCDNVKITLNNELQGLTTDVSKWYFGGLKLFEI